MEKIDVEIDNSDPKTHSEWFHKYFVIIIISAVLGLICGIAMIVFNYLMLFFSFSFSFLPNFIGPIIAGGLTSLVVKLGMKKNLFMIMGTGASDFIDEVILPELGYDRMPVLVGKTVATSWTFGSGMVCGKEGPGLLIGANLGYLIGNKLKRRDLALYDYYFIAASACTSSILRAPISGALFCAELPYLNHIRYRSLIPSIIASAIAYLTFCSVFGFTPLIATDLSALERTNFLQILPLLLFFGVLIGLFCLVVILLIATWMRKIKSYFSGKLGFWMLPLFGGLLYGLLLLIALPFIPSEYQKTLVRPDTSYISFITSTIDAISLELLFMLIILFVIAIICSIGFYNSAGLVLPSMLLGALFGGLFGVIFYPEYPRLFVILGISAVLGATYKNPITAILIIVEMTWNPILFIPASITTIIAFAFSGPKSITPGQRYVNISLANN